MNFKKSVLVLLSVMSSFGWGQPMSQPLVERPPRFPGPGNPRPEPRPEPRPSPRPEPRPEPRPSPRPEPRPEPRPSPRPEPRPEPRPSPRPEPRPPVRPDPRPPRPHPPGPIRPDPRPPVRPEPRPPRPHPRPRPRPPGHVRPHPRPYPPRPVRPLPPRPQPPILRPDPGAHFSQFVNLNYTVSNQYLDLIQMLSLYRYDSDYTVESVVVRTDGSDQSIMRLWVNNQVEDEVRWPSSLVSLYPRYDLRLGLEMQNLFLQIEGSSYIQQIEVRLRRVGYSGEYNQFHLPILIDEDLYDDDSVTINDWIDLSQYRGYRLIAVEVEADAYYEAEKISLIVDDSISGEAYVIGEEARVTIFPSSSVVLGSQSDPISLMANGGGVLGLKNVTLRLSRY